MDALLQACHNLYDRLPGDIPPNSWQKELQRDSELLQLSQQISELLNTCGPVYIPRNTPSPLTQSDPIHRAVCWNIERGKNFFGILKTLEEHPELKKADFYFLTEVDWGMARSDNRNVTAELAEALGLYGYFAPSYFNFTKGHGVERTYGGANQLGLHGKSILSRFPLSNLRPVAMPNATDKLTSEEARLGQKRALLGDVLLGDKTITLACAHLDAFSSPKTRQIQLAQTAKACGAGEAALLAGDWNTNTLDSTSTARLIPWLIYQLCVYRPVKMVRDHHPYPERRFDRPLFKMLEEHGFNYQNCNPMGVGTYDLVSNDQELGQMAGDQFPQWALKYVNSLITKAGGNIGLKLDWFASKNLNCVESQVVRLDDGKGPQLEQRASDHHPVWVDFKI